MFRKRTAKELISKEEMVRVASLAKLSLTPEEEERYRRELSAVLDYFRVIDGAPVEGITPSYRATDVSNVTRGDEVIPSHPEPILAGVPRKKGRLVKAPRVF